MTATSSRFLSVVAGGPNINTGWQIRILDYKDMTTLVAICNEFDSFQFTDQLNDVGTGSISIDTDSPWWRTSLNNGQNMRVIVENEYVFEAWENGVPRFAWLGQTVTNTIIGEDETHKTTISGPGIANVLTWACIQRPGWPKTPPVVGHDSKGNPIRRAVSYRDSKPAYLWQFPMKWPTMRMWVTVFLAAQRRGLLPFVKPQFSGNLDSARKPWKFVNTLQTIEDNHGYQPEELNENLLEFLNDCTGQDYTKWFGQYLEWHMLPGFKLHVRSTIGVNRTKTVRFYAGQIIRNERTRDREAVFNRVTATDVEGGESIRTDSASVARWNLRERRDETNKNVTDKKLRDDLADRYLKQSSGEKSQWSIKVPYDDYGRVPYRNFNLGDTVAIADSSAWGSMDSYRIMALSVSVTADQTVPELELTLQSIIDSRMTQLQKQITTLINNPKNFKIDQIKDVSIPEKPQVKSGLTYDPKTHKWIAVPIEEFGTHETGINIYIQAADPATIQGSEVATGDLWYDTDG